MLATILIALVAAIHVYILVLEMFLWDTKTGRKAFNLSADFARDTRVLAAIDARMGEVYWAEYQRDEQGVWHGEESEAVLKPEAVRERLQQLEGEWATVGTGWQAWPDMATGCGLTLADGEIELPDAQDMLPLACHLFTVGKTVAVEHAEPVYLRNEVAWKKLPGRE